MTAIATNMIEFTTYCVAQNAGPNFKAYVRYPIQTWGLKCGDEEDLGKLMSTAWQKQGTQKEMSNRCVGLLIKNDMPIFLRFICDSLVVAWY